MHRPAFSLLELILALAVSTILVGGLASSLYISSQALRENPNSSQQSHIAEIVLHDLASDLNQAIAFSERTATALTFTVPDRNGDNTPETLSYAWSGTPGDPLTYQYNGGTVINIGTDVQDFNMSALTRTMLSNFVPGPAVGNVVYKEFTEAKRATDGTNISIPKPPGTVAGDLLIAVVAMDGVALLPTAPIGWNVIDIGSYDGKVTLAIWWKNASASEVSSYSFNWVSWEQAYGWIMRFSGHDASNPIHVTAVAQGSTAVPISPAVATTTNNAMILRVMGADEDKITEDVPGLSGHLAITMDKSNSGGGSVSGGVGYVEQTAAGDSGISTFSLTQGKPNRTVTIAIAPGLLP